MATETSAALSPVGVPLTDIVCHLAVPVRIARNQPAVLTITLHNRGQQTLKLLKRNTPFEGWLADSLNVERDGQMLPYTGAMAKRMPPLASEYQRIKPSGRYQQRVTLQGGYDVSLPGSYRVQWRGEVMDTLFGAAKPNPDRLSPQTIVCAAVTFVRTS